MTNLSPKRERFCREYLVDLNATQAAIRAGYSTNSARSQACELLTNPNIERRIAELKAERAARTEITADDVVRELAKVGFASVGRFLDLSDPEAPCLTLEHATEDDLAAIERLDIEEVVEDHGANRRRVRKIRIKLHDKLKALHDLALHTDVFRKAKQGAVSDLAAVIAEINARGSRAPLAHEREDGDRVQ